MGGGGLARSVISRAREEVMVDKLSAPIKRAALGESGGPKTRKNWRAQQEMLTKARKAGVGAGIHQGMPPTTPGMTPDFASRWIKEYGCNVYVHAADVNLFSTQLKRDLLSLRGASNDAAEAPAKQGGQKRKLEAPVI